MSRTSEVLREQAELATPDIADLSVLPRIPYLRELVRNATGSPREIGDGLVAQRAFEMADTQEVLFLGLSSWLPEDEKYLDVPIGQLAAVMELPDDIMEKETLRQWVMRTYDDLYIANTWRGERFTVNVDGYAGELVAYASLNVFEEDIWFIVLATEDGTLIGWDSGEGLSW